MYVIRRPGSTTWAVCSRLSKRGPERPLVRGMLLGTALLAVLVGGGLLLGWALGCHLPG
jgi:hypothetical protein